MTVEAKEDDLGYGRHQLLPLLHKGHELISEIRVLDEIRRAEPLNPGKVKGISANDSYRKAVAPLKLGWSQKCLKEMTPEFILETLQKISNLAFFAI